MIHIIFLTIYLLLLVWLGIVKSKQIKNQTDFAVAGRKLNPWVLTGTLLATWIGTGTIMGNAGKTFDTGIAAWILPLSGVIGIALLTRIAGKVRSFEKLTIHEIIGERYGSLARFLSVIALVIAYLVIVSYQFNAGGAVVQFIFGKNEAGEFILSSQWATIYAAAFIILYTVLAGMVSIAYTDYVIGITMTAGLLLVVPILFFKAGGLNGIEQRFIEMGKPEHMKMWGVYSWTQILNYLLPPLLLVFGDANMYQRFSAASTQKGAKQAAVALVFSVLLIEWLVIAGAWISSALIPDAENGRYVMIYASFELLPPILGAVLLTTIVGIIISTADGFLLVPATSFVKDIYHQYINPKAGDKKIVLVSRLTVLALGIGAYFISRGFEKSEGFFERALYAYTIYGASITPVMFAAFFWKRASKAGAVACILSGVIVTLAWKELGFIKNLFPEKFYNSTDEVLPAIVISVFCLIVFSLLIPDKKYRSTQTLNH